MRVAINLASHPFVELRPLYAKLRLAMVALALLAIGLGFGLRSLTERAKFATAEMNALKARTAAFQNERQRDEARMRQPQNRAVLERSQFLNELFARKSFSWTAVMMDLERVLPAGVQVTSIEPRITKEGDVTIRLRVSGDRDQAVQLVRNLERSQRFLGPRLASETAQASDKNGAVQNVSNNSLEASLKLTGVEFDILSEYNPLPLVVTAKVKPDTDAATPANDAPKVKHVRKLPTPLPLDRKGAKR
jgi:type IV pilus assembly protein PilN